MTEESIDFNKYKYCECGCNTLILIKDNQYRYKKFKLGHSRKNRKTDTYKRSKNNDYYILYIPSYFGSDKQGRIKEHVYFYQEYFKCCMLPWGVVHHKDGNKENNIPYWNLQGMSRKHHQTLHNKGNKYGKKDMLDRKCFKCGSNKTWLENDGLYHWYVINNKYMCKKCWNRIIYKQIKN